ncbi:hypothetical protein [Cyanobacterium aponinum]|uniref:hypothetical protein n=1 Tax=Cyanobacterium aponinum TaxID=379064 RepID=UPI000C12B124|nr:hypothetical protein [Cyanobacterium aponinum]PHV61564.1 hypothetical protein CSQ80_15050 [Cyanobacterium aponinum IPPAS B-1201]
MTEQNVSQKPIIKPAITRKGNLDVEKIKVGEHLAEIQYYKVVKVNPKTIKVVSDKGIESNIDKDLVLEMYSASQYQTEKYINRTEINNILTNIGQQIFTVNFNKQVKPADIKNKLLTAIKDEEGNPLSYEDIEKNLKTISKDLNKGEERTLIGYLLEINNEMGRSSAIDLEIERGKNRLRQIDHRTINYLIFKNTKYIVK